MSESQRRCKHQRVDAIMVNSSKRHVLSFEYIMNPHERTSLIQPVREPQVRYPRG